jgi:hypothetical protein
MRTILLPCALLSCFPPAVASASTRSLPVRTSARQMSLMFWREIAIAAPVVVLEDNITVFAPSGSCMRPVDIAPPAPRCVLRRKSCDHVCRSQGNHSWYVPDSRRAMSKPFLGSEPCFSPVATWTVTPSARFSRDGSGDFRMSANGFRQCNYAAYRRKSSLWSGFSVKSSHCPAGFFS